MMFGAIVQLTMWFEVVCFVSIEENRWVQHHSSLGTVCMLHTSMDYDLKKSAKQPERGNLAGLLVLYLGLGIASLLMQ